MREILFRGKCFYNGKWAEGFIVASRENTYPNGFEMITVDGINYDELDSYIPHFTSYAVDPSTIGQYTGLKDKNGKKIFEGDIVRATIERSDGCQSPRTENGVIGYDCIGMIGLILYKDKNGENVWSDFFNELSMSGLIEDYYFEVIGNIHDNKLEDFENGC